jgi:hypothetical protein
MQRAFGLNIPQTLDDVCDPARLALIVCDMQVGIVKQIENGQQITDRVLQVRFHGAPHKGSKLEAGSLAGFGGDDFGRSSTARRRIIGERPAAVQTQGYDGRHY